MGKGLRILGLAAAVVGLGAVARYTVLAPDPVPVTVFRVAAGRVEDTVTNSKAGTVATRRRAGLAPRIPGLVAELPAREGESVRAGQVVLRLRDEDLAAQVALAERSRDTARAARQEACLGADLAERELARSRSLYRDRIVSADALDKVRSRAETTRAACAAARAREAEADAASAVARTELAKTVVHAPFAGIVAELRAEVGEFVSPAPTGVAIPPILDLIDTSSIYVSAPLDEVDLGKVRVDQPVRVTLDPYPEREAAGRVVRVAPYVDAAQDQNRTFEVEVELDDQAFAARLAPGTTADVEVVLQARDDVLRVPSYALLQGRRVLVVREGVLESVAVETGLRNWQFVEVTSGLGAGDAVVVSLDRAEVHAGARVEIVDETDR